MSMKPEEYAAKQNADALRARVAAERMHTIKMVRDCKTDDEKYARVKAAADKAMIWSMIHGS